MTANALIRIPNIFFSTLFFVVEGYSIFKFLLFWTFWCKQHFNHFLKNIKVFNLLTIVMSYHWNKNVTHFHALSMLNIISYQYPEI